MSTRHTLLDNASAKLWYHPDAGIVQYQFLQPVAEDSFRTVLMSGLRYPQEHGARKGLSDDRKTLSSHPKTTRGRRISGYHTPQRPIGEIGRCYRQPKHAVG